MKNWLSLGQGAEELEGTGDRTTYFPLYILIFWNFYHMHLLVFQIVKQNLKRHGHVVDTAHSLLIPTS